MKKYLFTAISVIAAAAAFAEEKADTALGAFPEENSPDLPWRPIPVSVNRSQIRFHFPGKTAPETLILKAEGAFHSGFRIRKNEGVDWFSVTPEQGTIRAGEELAFTIKLHPEKMPRAQRYKDAFLIRMPDGFSRPVMVYADMRESGELRAKEKGVFLSIDAGELEYGEIPCLLENASNSVKPSNSKRIAITF